MHGWLPPHPVSVRQDETGVSEIVGALMLVVVVSSAAFGFGVFLHQQAKQTQAQKAADLERKLERVEVTSVLPLDADFDAACTPTAADGSWNVLTFTFTSTHLHATHVDGLRLNGMAVRYAKVGATTYDFSLAPTDPAYAAFVVQPRQQVAVVLPNVETDASATGACSSAQPYSLFTAPTPIATTAALHVELLTSLTNDFERVFVPPTAVASLEPVAGAAATYSLVGTASAASGDGTFLVQWTWSLSDVTGGGACGQSDADAQLSATSGHRVQSTGLTAGRTYCAALDVQDNDGLSSSASVQFVA